MKKKVGRFLIYGLIALAIFQLSAFPSRLISQEYPSKKQISDYLSSFLARSTQPLGLKEDQRLRQLLFQAPIKWAIRSSVRHILN